MVCYRWFKLNVIKLSEINGIIINKLIPFPGNKRLLIHTRDSLLRTMDIKTSVIIQWYQVWKLFNVVILKAITIFHCSDISNWNSNGTRNSIQGRSIEGQGRKEEGRGGLKRYFVQYPAASWAGRMISGQVWPAWLPPLWVRLCIENRYIRKK